MSGDRRTIVVTGSASGMGAAIARRLEKAGARVVGIDRQGAEVLADLATEPGRRSAIEAASDISSGSLDGAVVCAGLGPHVTETADIVRVNYFGAIRVLDGLLPILARGVQPAAVAIASNAASLTPQHPGLLEVLAADDEDAAAEMAGDLEGVTVYGMSKLALTRALRRRARTWGESGVRLNAVAPGPIETPMLEGILADRRLRTVVEALPVPLRRRGTPEEVAEAVVFLLDPVNRFVHGAVLFVDGGSDAEFRPDAI